jgi:hypothetical protein
VCGCRARDRTRSEPLTGFNRRSALVPCDSSLTQSHLCCQRTPTVELPHQNDLELALPSRCKQLLALGAVIFGIRAKASMASVTVQPRRVANLRIASICMARVCWSGVDTRADRATRMGDTKPPGKWRKPTVAFPGVRGSQISGGKPPSFVPGSVRDGLRAPDRWTRRQHPP